MKSIINISIFMIIWLIITPSLVCGGSGGDDDDDDDDDKRKPICKSHDDCYKILGLNTYCCQYDGCCNWFRFLIFYNQQKTSKSKIEYKGPSIIYIAIISTISLLSLILICCLTCVCCLCKQCGCCKKNKKIGRGRINLTNQNRTFVPQQSVYIPIAQVPSSRQFFVTQEQINQQPTTSRVEPSAPLLNDELNDILPHNELDFDKPPAYDDLIRTGEVSVIINERVINTQR